MNLVLSTDGVNIKKSTYGKELWRMAPVLRFAADITYVAKERYFGMSFCGFWSAKLAQIVPRLRAELNTPIEIDSPDSPRKTAVFKVRLLVADMCAKAHVLNMMQFNGFFGCHFCTAEGRTIGKTHAY